jgi:hypothetical protein
VPSTGGLERCWVARAQRYPRLTPHRERRHAQPPRVSDLVRNKPNEIATTPNP